MTLKQFIRPSVVRDQHSDEKVALTSHAAMNIRLFDYMCECVDNDCE
jgi:hypothetical protein